MDGFSWIKGAQLNKLVLVPLTLSFTYIFGYIILQRVSVSQYRRVHRPPLSPGSLSFGFHGNATEHTQSERGDRNKGGAEMDPSQWIYHMNYKNLLHCPKPTFLPHYRTPCVETGSKILCLPSVYLAGMPKSGTSDLFWKIVRHPSIIPTQKEPHWWTRHRFSGNQSVGSYMEKFYRKASKEISKRCNHEGNMCYHADLLVDGSASTFWDNFQWKLLPSNKDKDEPVTLNAHHIKYLTPDVKIIVIFRNPIDRLYSDYLYFQSHTSTDQFHEKVKKSIQIFSQCLNSDSPRKCAYNMKNKIPVRLHIGLYSIYVNDWLNIFPRDQFYFATLDEYSRNKETVMKEIFKFLLLESPGPSYFEVLDELPNTNTRRKAKKLIGDMRNDTRRLLRDFYMPFNRHLVDTLKDDRFAFIS